MKWSKRQLTDVECRAEAIEVSLAEVCRRASVNQTSWTQWKFKKVQPRSDTWERVDRAIRALETEHRAARAA